MKISWCKTAVITGIASECHGNIRTLYNDIDRFPSVWMYRVHQKIEPVRHEAEGIVSCEDMIKGYNKSEADRPQM